MQLKCPSVVRVSLMAAAVLGAAMPVAGQVDISWVTVSDAGNSADPATGFGAVGYEYRIGRYEVTNAQYVTFLNAAAVSDPNGLYSTSMGSDPRAGITRSGADGSFSYSVKPNMGNKPVNYVSWYDAARFCNWMTNGQPSGGGGTESGVYTLTGPTSISGITRDLNNSGQVFLPLENEWYKAAYHHPASQGGDSDDYWLYATRSNTAPAIAAATSSGNVANPSANVANYDDGADWNGQNGNVTTVGSAASPSFYNTSDMNGNLAEWNETSSGSFRGLRGGDWSDPARDLESTRQGFTNPGIENVVYGFRVASPVPLPCTGDVADDDGSVGNRDGMVSFGDFLALLGLVGPCPGGTPGCTGDIADDFGTLGSDGQVSFGDFLALLGLVGPCP